MSSKVDAAWLRANSSAPVFKSVQELLRSPHRPGAHRGTNAKYLSYIPPICFYNSLGGIPVLSGNLVSSGTFPKHCREHPPTNSRLCGKQAAGWEGEPSSELAAASAITAACLR